MVYYLHLPGGFPEWARGTSHEALRRLERHPLLGVFTDPQSLFKAYAEAKHQALERIQRNGRPNLTADEIRGLERVRLRLVVSARTGRPAPEPYP